MPTTNPPLNSTSTGRGSFRRYLLLGLSVTLLQCALPSISQAQDDVGSWDGALWRFELTPKEGNPHKGTLRGRFRVEKLKVYQAGKPGDTEMTKPIGESKPGPGKRPSHAILTLDDFRAKDGSGEFVKGMKGVVRLERDDRDHNHGVFIAKDGYHWDLKCTRIQD